MKITLDVFIALFTNIMCLPLWTEYDYGSFIRTLFNKEARLDLVYTDYRGGPFSFPAIFQTMSYLLGLTPQEIIHRTCLSLRSKGE